jgi:hypothetical protein
MRIFEATSSGRSLFRLRASQQAHQLRLNGRKRMFGHSRAGMNHEVPSRLNFSGVQPQYLAGAAANPVANHGPTQHLADTHAETAAIETIRTAENREAGSGHAAPLAVDGIEIGAAHQPAGTRPAAKREG